MTVYFELSGGMRVLNAMTLRIVLNTVIIRAI